MHIGIPYKYKLLDYLMGKQLPDDKKSEQESLHRGDDGWKIMTEHVFDTHIKFDKMYPETKHMKRRTMELYSHNKYATGEKLMSTLKRKNTKYSKKTVHRWQSFYCLMQNVPCHILMSPVTSPNDHSPVKPTPSV